MHWIPTPPERRPRPGFFIHHKYNAQTSRIKYLYEVFGVAYNLDTKSWYVTYRPLYEPLPEGVRFLTRSLDDFMKPVVVGESEVDRYARTTEPEYLALCAELRIRYHCTNKHLDVSLDQAALT